MKMGANPLLIVVRAAIAWTVVACGCSSGGSGPALPPFNPFGVDRALPTGNEPTISGADQPPAPPSAQGIAELCAIDCTRIMRACPGLVSPDCASSCSTIPPELAGCTAQIQAYLACISTAALDCSGGGLSAPACDGASIAIINCGNAGAM